MTLARRILLPPLAAAVFLAGCSAASPQAAPFSVQESGGSLAESLYELICAAPEEVFGPKPTSENFHDATRRIALECKSTVPERANAGRTVEAFSRCFFSRLGFCANPALHSPDALFPHDVASAGRGSCLAVSGLYMAAAEHLGLPVHGVLVPGHFFIRFDDGRTRFNIETLHAGRRFSDGWYAERYRVPRNSACYLRNLAPEEVGAVFWFNAGNTARSAGNYDFARSAYMKAIAVLPGFAEAHGNLGLLLAETGDVEGALVELRAAAALNPLDPAAHLNLGALLWRSGSLNEAAAACRKGLSLAPRHPELLCSLGVLRLQQGRTREAVTLLRRAAAIRPSYELAEKALEEALKRRKYPVEQPQNQ
ncbi:MAG TPA: tetratricopeptide repeat protein [Planctomycetes bacterium]|nr:tetratricopeptide repeat protein [Planctomycetota bacterium]